MGFIKSHLLPDIDTDSVRGSAVNIHYNVNIASARERLRQQRVDLIESGEPALRPGELNHGVCAADLDAHIGGRAAVANPGPEQNQEDLIRSVAQVNRDRDEAVLPGNIVGRN